MVLNFNSKREISWQRGKRKNSSEMEEAWKLNEVFGDIPGSVKRAWWKALGEYLQLPGFVKMFLVPADNHLLYIGEQDAWLRARSVALCFLSSKPRLDIYSLCTLGSCQFSGMVFYICQISSIIKHYCFSVHSSLAPPARATPGSPWARAPAELAPRGHHGRLPGPCWAWWDVLQRLWDLGGHWRAVSGSGGEAGQ